MRPSSSKRLLAAPTLGRPGCVVSLTRRESTARMGSTKHYFVLLRSAAFKEVSDEIRH
jgi:hypothetical protein